MPCKSVLVVRVRGDGCERSTRTSCAFLKLTQATLTYGSLALTRPVTVGSRERPRPLRVPAVYLNAGFAYRLRLFLDRLRKVPCDFPLHVIRLDRHRLRKAQELAEHFALVRGVLDVAHKLLVRVLAPPMVLRNAGQASIKQATEAAAAAGRCVQAAAAKASASAARRMTRGLR